MSGIPQGEQAAEASVEAPVEAPDGPQPRTVNMDVKNGTGIGWADKVFIKKIREHRTRILFVMVPAVTAGGAFLAGMLMPHESAAPEHRSQGEGKPPPVVPSSPSPAGSPSPSSSPSASAAPLPPALSVPTRAPTGPAAHDDTGRPTPAPDRPPAPTARGAAPRPPAPQAAPLSPGSRSHLENAAQHQCLSGDDFYPAFGPCDAGDGYSWTLRSAGNGTFTVRNRASGKCLTAPANNDYQAGLNVCDWGGNEHWSFDATNAAGRTLRNAETGHCLTIAPPVFGGSDYQVRVTTCDSDDPRQLWRGGGSA
ncbi:RICIN domain-containing protein [Streptomyces mobaraensis]|uniref:RICIN domain-containing protein n=1 Tax=Streptomyces mobaraensis TaxID=35621 RepID=UPI003327CE9C